MILLSLQLNKNEIQKHSPRLFLFFNYYLAAPRPTLGHCQVDTLTNPMLITAFLLIPTRRSEGAS